MVAEKREGCQRACCPIKEIRRLSEKMVETKTESQIPKTGKSKRLGRMEKCPSAQAFNPQAKKPKIIAAESNTSLLNSKNSVVKGTKNNGKRNAKTTISQSINFCINLAKFSFIFIRLGYVTAPMQLPG